MSRRSSPERRLSVATSAIPLATHLEHVHLGGDVVNHVRLAIVGPVLPVVPGVARASTELGVIIRGHTNIVEVQATVVHTRGPLAAKPSSVPSQNGIARSDSRRVQTKVGIGCVDEVAEAAADSHSPLQGAILSLAAGEDKVWVAVEHDTVGVDPAVKRAVEEASVERNSWTLANATDLPDDAVGLEVERFERSLANDHAARLVGNAKHGHNVRTMKQGSAHDPQLRGVPEITDG